MATYVPVVKNDTNGAILYTGLIDQSNTKLLKSTPTLAAGDFKVSIDGGALANLGTLPTVTPAAGRQIKITLSQSEVNGDNITIQCVDAAGAEWCDQIINIQTAARHVDDLAFPATTGRSMVVDASGLVDANAVKLGPTGSGTAQTARDVGASVLLSTGTGTGQLDFTSGVVKANLAQILGTALTETAGLLAGGFKKFFNIATPAATMDHGVLVDTVTNLTNLPSIPANWLTASGINADAITAAKIADGAIDRATYAADTGHQSIRSGTAQAGAVGSITLDAGASAVNNFYSNCIVYITGGTGAGQGRFITSYAGATKVAIVPNWATAPDNTSTFAILPFDAVTVSAVPTTAQIATAVWQDTTAGDFTVANSVGKSVMNGVSLGTGLTVANLTNAPTTGDFTATMKTSLNAATPAATVSDKTGFALTAAYDPAKTAAQAGDAMALTAGERNSVADALLDRASGVETGVTLRQGQRVMLSAMAGKADGLAGTTVHYRDQADGKNRITATVDSSGNRTAVTLDAS